MRALDALIECVVHMCVAGVCFVVCDIQRGLRDRDQCSVAPVDEC
ncbi:MULTISPECIES: hypothetical protein [unclassified Pseudomonas]|nr:MULTISPECIES: hypothetical protein [unclassified Pseudomonas]